MLLFTERVSQHALQKSLPTELTVSSSLWNYFTVAEGGTLGSFSAKLPLDLFFPEGGLQRTFLFLDKLDVVGDFNRSRRDTTRFGTSASHPPVCSDTSPSLEVEAPEVQEAIANCN